MQLTNYPTILGCLGDKCREFVPDGLLSLMDEAACKAIVEQGLEALRLANPAMTFIGRCISWGVSS
jgi:hypothetical protein